MKYIASCSFGKDSLAAIIECERRGIHIDKALYCRIMFDAETSAELPEHEEFIHCRAIPLLQSRYGIETEIVQADVSYCDCFLRQYKHSKKHGDGAIWGFPCLTAPWCNTYLKVNVLNKWAKSAGEHTQILGIAADETRRISHKTNQGKFLPLVDWGITEAERFNICRKEGLLSPAYNGGRKRLGCWFCHNQRISELCRLRSEHPELWAKMLVLDKASLVRFKPDKTLTDFDRRFAEEERQLSFDFKWGGEKVKPILFNTEMVRAILAGRKTVTRRLIKLAPADEYHFIELETDPDEIRIQPGSGEEYPYKLSGLYAVFTGKFGYPMVKAPYQSGDVLYVRETWCKGSLNGGAEQYFYRADENEFYCSWKPSIHMPKGAARIFLRVTDVRVERLQDIRLEGCLAEGVQLTFLEERDFAKRGLIAWQRYSTVWDSTINKAGLDKYGWDANPYVWVVSFERISKEEVM